MLICKILILFLEDFNWFLFESKTKQNKKKSTSSSALCVSFTTTPPPLPLPMGVCFVLFFWVFCFFWRALLSLFVAEQYYQHPFGVVWKQEVADSAYAGSLGWALHCWEDWQCGVFGEGVGGEAEEAA